MQISWKWLSEMVDVGNVGGPRGLAELLTNRGLEVEELRSLAKGFDKVVTAQILERNPHPQADRLSLCKVSIGQGEPLDIVCGAQNMKAGDKVALAMIGADLPNGMKIQQSKIRGVTSNGMLCSEQELCMAASSEGILILPPDTALGRPLAEVLGRDDTILTFKLTANRGDCMSHYGMAREVASALGKKPRTLKTAEFSLADSPISIHLDAGEAVPQFWGVYIDGVKIGPSPAWVVNRLESVGLRSINNVVDATNLALLEVGHPMHAYDADLIEGKKIGARMARKDERLPLLDGQTVTLDGSEIVIEDGKRAVGLGGVMGGGNSEVRDTTSRIFLECAEFAPVLIRRAAQRHQRRSEAALRFEKGIDPLGLRFAIGRLAQLVLELAGGRIVGATLAALPSRDQSSPEAAARTERSLRRRIVIKQGYLQKFLGIDLSDDDFVRILEAHDCRVENAAGEWNVFVPTYRNDLSIKEDLTEEVARTVGYNKIPSTIPVLTTPPSPITADPTTARAVLIDRAKDALAQAGLLETVNFAFTSKAWLRQFGMTSTAVLLNPLSEEHEALVPSLIPGLVHNALDNWRLNFGSDALPIRLFELRPTFHASEKGIAARGETETGVEEKWKISFLLSGPRYASGLKKDLDEVDFYDLKGAVELLLEGMGARGVRFQPLTASRNPDAPMTGLFHPGQSVEVLAGNTVAGYFGLFHPGMARGLKAKAPLWIAELDWDALAKQSRQVTQPKAFKAWPSFPPMERDFAIVVKNEVTADKITQLAIKAGKPLAKVVKVFDIYKGPPVAEGMTSVAVRVIFYEDGRSLQESETESASTRILELWKKELGAELRS